MADTHCKWRIHVGNGGYTLEMVGTCWKWRIHIGNGGYTLEMADTPDTETLAADFSQNSNVQCVQCLMLNLHLAFVDYELLVERMLIVGQNRSVINSFYLLMQMYNVFHMKCFETTVL
jgi:hypothetical protein